MKPSNDREAVTLILSGLVEKGWTVTGVVEDTWNPDEITAVPVNDVSTAVDLVTGVDEAWVYVEHPEHTSWIRFVLGNSPEEVVYDHGLNLSPYIDPIIDPWWN